MNKEEAIKFYSQDVPEPKYGDRVTTESISKCYDQVMQKIEEGVEDWDGCVGKAKCCKMFTHKFDLLKTAKQNPLLSAHFKGDEGDFPVTLSIKHRCNLLDDQDKCSIYDNRPQPCKEYLCQASNVRRDMFLRIKNPHIAKLIDEGEKKVFSKPEGSSAKREDAKDNE